MLSSVVMSQRERPFQQVTNTAVCVRFHGMLDGEGDVPREDDTICERRGNAQFEGE